MEFDHEKFAGIQELAEISTKISAGTAALAALGANEETYITEREARLVARLKQTLVESGDLIKAIGENHDSLVGYKTELDEFYKKVLCLIQSVHECQTLIDTVASDLDERIKQHETDLVAFREATARENTRIEARQTELSGWQDRLGADQRLFDDRNAEFQRTINRIKK